MSDPSLYRNLGFFAIALVVILLLAFVFLLLKLVHKLYPKVAAVKDKIAKIIFYKSPIRYIIEGNLKLAHNSLVYVAVMGSFTTASSGG